MQATNIIITSTYFINVIIIAIIFFFKERIHTFENRAYGFLIIISLIEGFNEILGFLILKYYGYNNLIYLLSCKIILISYPLWVIDFLLYNVIITFNLKQTSKKSNYILSLFIITAIFISLIIAAVPISFSFINGLVIPLGYATTIVYITCGITDFFIVVLLLYSLKKGFNTKFIPAVCLFLLGIIVVFFQFKNPQFLLIGPLLSLITFIMYHTIENPDLKMIEQLNIAKSQADRANNAKTEFLSSMSHEIRTPLNAIVGFSNTLNENPKLPEELKDEVIDILTASDNLLEIVNGVLDISKIEANKIEIVKKEYDTKKMFEELCKLTKSRIGTKPIEFVSKIDKSIPRVLYGDSVRVKQVILNLLTNAAKYTDEGKIIFTVNSVKKDNIVRLIVSVEDTGRGIKEQNINKLFTKFERLDEEGNTTIEGTGLGLAITKKLVELMHGNIVVQSKFGKGSKFTVSIDQGYVDKPNIKLDETSVIMESINLKGKRILLVDDNKLNIKVASRLLEPYKADITTLLSGEETIELLKKDNKYDLILLDDMMPKLSGTDTFKKIKEDKLFDGPIVVLTANALTGEKEKYLEIGFDDYLAKPIENIELNRVLKKYLKK